MKPGALTVMSNVAAWPMIGHVALHENRVTNWPPSVTSTVAAGVATPAAAEEIVSEIARGIGQGAARQVAPPEHAASENSNIGHSRTGIIDM